MAERKYIVGSGWYAANGRGTPRAGGKYSRTVQFHDLWKTCVFRYSQPAAVVIIDSASPVPLPPDPRELVIRLDSNYQHTDPILTGWGRSFILGALYAYCCMADFFYVEQDDLAIGDWVNETYREAAKYPKAFFAGSPYKGSSYVLQMGLVFVPRHLILSLVKAFPDGPRDKGRDEDQLGRCGVPLKHLPFGPGRNRPFNLKNTTTDIHHCSDEEALQIADFLGMGDKVRNDFQHPETWQG